MATIGRGNFPLTGSWFGVGRGRGRGRGRGLLRAETQSSNKADLRATVLGDFFFDEAVTGITHEGTTTAVNTASNTSILIAYPAGILADDVLVLFTTVSVATPPNNPAGFTSQGTADAGGSSPSMRASTRVCDGSETGNLTITMSTSTSHAVLMLFRGVDTTTPLDVAPTTFGSASATSAYSLPTLTPTVDGAALAYAGFANAATGTYTQPNQPAPFTETYDNNTALPGTSTGYRILAGGGATGTVNLTRSTSIRGGGILLALRPQGIGGGTAADGTGSLTLTGSGATTSAATGTGALSFGGTGNTTTPVTATADLTLSATGTAAVGGSAATGTGSLSLTGTATAASASTGTGSVTLTGTGVPSAAITGAGALTLTGTGTAATTGAATAAVTLTGTATPAATSTGSAALTLTGTGNASGGGVATGTGSLALTLTGAATVAATGSATITLTASGTSTTPITGAATLTLAATGALAARANATALIELTATGAASGGGVPGEPIEAHAGQPAARWIATQPTHRHTSGPPQPRRTSTQPPNRWTSGQPQPANTGG